ncbi:MAG: DinB family protein [Terracidiphilus sp.]
MPVASEIGHAAGGFNLNANLLEKSFEGLTPEEWQKSPNEMNPMIWIAGHIVWARSRALNFLGTKWSRPWLAQFGRGEKIADLAQCPSPEEVLLAWQDVKKALNSALEDASDETLCAGCPPGPPSFDGKLSGSISFFALHESYHVGQAACLRRWLGHGQIAG